jgi:hypothetical protein
MSPESTVPRLRPFRRWVRRITLSLLCLLIVFVVSAWVYLRWSAALGKAELAEALAETEALDPRWRWEQIEEDWPTVADQENAAIVLGEVGKAAGDWPHRNYFTLIVEEGTWPSGSAIRRNLPTVPANRQWDEERLDLVLNWLRDKAGAVKKATSLENFPKGRAPVAPSSDPEKTSMSLVSALEVTCDLLEMDVERLLHASQAERVPARILALLHALRSLRDHPFVIAHLYRFIARRRAVMLAERLLGMTQVADADLLRLRKQFESECAENALLVAVRGQRALCQVLLSDIAAGRKSVGEVTLPGRGPGRLAAGISQLIYPYRRDEDHAFLLRAYNEAQVIAQLPWHEQSEAWWEFERERRIAWVEGQNEFRWLLSRALVESGMDTMGRIAVNDQALLRCAQVALAAERFRLRHKRWPNELQELVPAFLPAVLLDPHVNQPLRLARREDGIAVYSVGPDREDHGGAFLHEGEGQQVKSDLGFRLWNPDKRGLPPLPVAQEPKDD